MRPSPYHLTVRCDVTVGMTTTVASLVLSLGRRDHTPPVPNIKTTPVCDRRVTTLDDVLCTRSPTNRQSQNSVSKLNENNIKKSQRDTLKTKSLI